MSRPVPVSIENLPPRYREGTGAGRDEAEIFALQAQGNLFETVRELIRRVDALENRVNRIFVSGG